MEKRSFPLRNQERPQSRFGAPDRRYGILRGPTQRTVLGAPSISVGCCGLRASSIIPLSKHHFQVFYRGPNRNLRNSSGAQSGVKLTRGPLPLINARRPFLVFECTSRALQRLIHIVRPAFFSPVEKKIRHFGIALVKAF